MIPYKDIFIAFDRAKVKYLVAGGFAVNFHHVNRATVDLDLILHLEENNILKFNEVMTELGFKPRLPVDGKDLADADKRREWITEKNMVVFSYIHPQHHFALIDVFVEEPKPFAEMDRQKLIVKAFGAKIPVVGLNDLIELKQQAARPKDLLDIQMLKEKQHE